MPHGRGNWGLPTPNLQEPEKLVLFRTVAPSGFAEERGERERKTETGTMAEFDSEASLSPKSTGEVRFPLHGCSGAHFVSLSQ